MANRLVLSPSMMRQSRRGVNVLSPPSTTPQHLIFDSEWEQAQRLVTLAEVANTNLETDATVNWPTQDVPPLTLLYHRNPSTFVQRSLDYFLHPGHFNGSTVTTAMSRRWLLKPVTTAGVVLHKLKGGASFPGLGTQFGNDLTFYDFFVLALADD